MKSKSFAAFSLMLCMLIGCASNAAENIEPNQYEEIMNQENAFVPISMKEAIEILENKETALIYFGFPDCPWCIEALPVMNEVAETHGKEIYYVQTRDEEGNRLYDDEEKEIILNYVGEFEEKDDEGNLALFVPLVVSVKDGIAVSGNVGTVEGHDAHEREMTEEEVEMLKDIYDEMFE